MQTLLNVLLTEAWVGGIAFAYLGWLPFVDWLNRFRR